MAAPAPLLELPTSARLISSPVGVVFNLCPFRPLLEAAPERGACSRHAHTTRDFRRPSYNIIIVILIVEITTARRSSSSSQARELAFRLASSIDRAKLAAPYMLHRALD